MPYSVSAVSNPNELSEIGTVWDGFIDKHSKNPFLLSGFIRQAVEKRADEWSPLTLTISEDDQLVGLAAFKLKQRFGVRYVTLLPHIDKSPDLIIDSQHREASIQHTLSYLFNTLRIHSIHLTLPAESPNLQILERQCKAQKIYFNTQQAPSHRILYVEHSWDEFKALRMKNPHIRKKFKGLDKVERILNRAGPCRIECVENYNGGPDVMEQVLEVERNSWKEEWRAQRNISADLNLLEELKGPRDSARNNPYLKSNVWFLKLNGQPLAYSLVLQYKDFAFMLKTSYNQRYRKYSPGIYLNNVAIKELLDSGKIRIIDFLTDLAFGEIWSDNCLSRVKVIMGRGIMLKACSEVAYRLRLRARAATLWNSLRGRTPRYIRKMVEQKYTWNTYRKIASAS